MSIRPLASDISELLLDTYDSNLRQTATSGSSTISVYSISNFAINQVLLIGELGDEGSEIIKTHASTAPTGNTITLASNLVKSHPGDVKVYVILFDQLEFSHSATIGGTKTVLSTSNIDPERNDTLYVDSTNTSGYYFTRYKNSISGGFSDYSDPIPFNGFDSNTVNYIINMAMDETQKQYTDKLTYQLLIQEINECLRYVNGKLKKWSNNQKFGYNLGQLNRGIYRMALPTDYYDQHSNRSMLEVRIGDNEQNLIYQDKIEFDNLMAGVNHTTVTTQALAGDTTLSVDNVADYPDNGSINIYISNTSYAITYTGRDLSLNQFTGIPAVGTGSISTTIAVNTDVWYGESEGNPFCYTIYDGYIYFWYLNGTNTDSRTIYLSYYTDIVEVDSDADVIPLTRFDMIKHWLKWAIRAITERNGKRDLNDSDFMLFTTILNDAIRRESSGQKYKMMPKVSGISYRKITNQNYDEYLRS